MGIRDAFRSIFSGREARIEFVGNTIRELVVGMTPEELYRSQPHLRIVVSFVARNVAHLGLKGFDRESDTSRKRLDKSDPLALLLKRPNADTTQYELLEALASDLALYDIAYWILVEVPEAPSGWEIRPIPPAWVVQQKGGTAFASASYVIQTPEGRQTEVPAADMLVFHGWNPGKPKRGASPVETLKQILAEQIQAWAFREQIWKRAGRIGMFITRPVGASWSDTARDRFMTSFKSRFTGAGSEAGGTPILEDGMTINQVRFNAREEQWVDAAKLALSTTAAVYHVNPVMVGILDNANFSNTKEFRKMLYSETLGPTLARLEDRINTFLVPRVSKSPDAYVEFNIEEKLQGDFEEQAAILSTSTGAPWMTVNEARSLRNLPRIEGGDELVVPLNVTVGGQASPRDSGTQNEKSRDIGELRAISAAKTITPKAVSAKSVTEGEYVYQAEELLKKFFARQRKGVLSSLGSKSSDWWDEKRWDEELTDDLLALAESVTKSIAGDVLRGLGLSPSDYSVEQTEAFLKDLAAGRARSINSSTRTQIQAILDGEGPEGVDDPAHVFDVAEESEAKQRSITLVTTLAGFATVEAAKQNGRASKSWVVTSANPRPSHASMDGETVDIDDTFSNGARWPGDKSALDVEEIAGCSCDVVVTFG